jgi:GMP synthase-like glutamine amidotransferase
MGINNTPPVTWTKIIQSMVFIEYLHEHIVLLLSFVEVMQYPSKVLLICYGAQRIFNIP